MKLVTRTKKYAVKVIIHVKLVSVPGPVVVQGGCLNSRTLLE